MALGLEDGLFDGSAPASIAGNSVTGTENQPISVV
jgi:hypothetical protein